MYNLCIILKHISGKMHVFRAAKTGLSSSEQIRITLIYVAIISFLCLWIIRMHNTINHEVNSLQSNCLNKADQPIGDWC